MHVRMSVWHSLVHFGWEYPQWDPISKAEEMEQQRAMEEREFERVRNERVREWNNGVSLPIRATRIPS